jgi:hypothetical protein
VRLDERVEGELRRVVHQPRGLAVVEVAEQEQDGVGAAFLRDVEVLLLGEEAFGEQRQRGRRASRAEVVPAAAEPLVDEDRAGRRPRSLERGGEAGRVGVGTKVACRGRASLHLGDRAEAGLRKGVAEPHASAFE